MQRRSSPRIISGAIALTLAIAVFAIFPGVNHVSAAVTNTWTGAVDSNWSTNGNWSMGTPVNGQILDFPSGVTATSTDDIVGLSIAGMTIEESDCNWFSGSTALTLTGNVTDSDTGCNDRYFMPIVLGANVVFTTHKAFLFESTVGETGGAQQLTVGNGSGGELDIFGAGSWTGGTVINNGGELDAGAALGTGSITINSGGWLGVDAALNNNISAAGSGGFHTGAISYLHSGGTLSGTLTLTANATISGSFSGGLNISGKITGAHTLSVSGFSSSSVLTLSSSTSDYSGGTNISGSTVNANSNSAFGSGTVAAGSGSNSAIVVGNNVNIANNLTYASSDTGPLSGVGTPTSSWSGPISISGSGLTLSAASNKTFTIDGAISGTGGVTKTGAGTVVFGVGDTYGGATDLQAGVTDIVVSTPFSSGVVTAESGAALQLVGPVTVSNTLHLTGTGVSGIPALQGNGGATDTWSGSVVLQSGTDSIGSNSGSALQISGVISGGGNLEVDNSGTTTLNGTAANTYTGSTTVNNGALALSDTGGVAVPSATVTVGTGGGTADLTNGGNNQIATGATVNIGTGGHLLLGGFGQTLAALNITSSTSGVMDDSNGGTLTVQNITTSAQSSPIVIGASTPSFGVLQFSPSATLTVADGAANPDLLIDAVIGGSNSFSKAGTGTLRSVANNTLSATLTLTSGQTFMDGNSPNTNYTVNAGATASGSGQVGTLTSVGGAISPGDSPGILSESSVSMDSATTYNVEIAGATAGSGYDQLNSSGPVSLGGATLSVALQSFTPTAGEAFTIIHNGSGSPVSGTFGGLTEGTEFTAGGVLFSITYKGGASGRDVQLVQGALPVTTPAVPATGAGQSSPLAPMLLLVGAMALYLRRRRPLFAL